MGRLEGKVAVVTGAARGMGLADAQLFAKEGAKVVATDVQVELLQEGVQRINESGGEAIAIKLDVSAPDEWKEVIQQTVETFGKVDILVNNAGIHVAQSIAEATVEDWNKVLATNLTGVFLGMREVIPEMQKNGGGSIVNMSSIAALVGGESADGRGAAYSASKGAVRSLTKHAAQMHAQDNIRVNSIHPGPIKTPMLGEAQEIMGEIYKEMVPIAPHHGEAIDIAYGALYLASDESRFVTAEELVIDGGAVTK